MIVANLVVRDVARSLAFYNGVLGFDVAFTVDKDKNTTFDMSEADKAVFTIVKNGDDELMIQSVESLAEELPEVFGGDYSPQVGGTIYLRGYPAEDMRKKVPDDAVLMEPRRSWYGMLEMYVRDPDGHILCMGAPDGEAPV